MNNEQNRNTTPETSDINNKNSPTEMNRQFLKMETPHKQTTHNLTTQNKH